jgi:Zn finger protein HypA/HybF involved in hydrogenase expression
LLFFFGMRRRSREIGRYELDCPKCGGKHFHQVIGIKRILTIFFIPLIPLLEIFRATCENCHKHHSIRLDQLPARA